MAWKASPTAWVDVAQAVTTGNDGPFALYFIATFPDAIFAIIMGIKNGDIFLSLNIFSHCS